MDQLGQLLFFGHNSHCKSSDCNNKTDVSPIVTFLLLHIVSKSAISREGRGCKESEATGFTRPQQLLPIINPGLMSSTILRN